MIVNEIPPEYSLAGYSYVLPPECIAQAPPARRGDSRLLVLRRAEKSMEDAAFVDLGRYLPPGALLVTNASRVVPARLFGTKPSGGRREFLLLTPLPLLLAEAREEGGRFCAEAEGLLRGAKKSVVGDVLRFGSLELTLLERSSFGKCRARLAWSGDPADILAREGALPLPPYIRRPADAADAERYQTVYARTPGSAAAPTAGLHFTRELLDELDRAGFGRAELELHVGYGTFSPVRCADIRRHRMHAEYCVIPAETAEAVRRAKAEGRPVVAVGSTAARALEGAFAARGELREFRGWTDIFLHPGARFHVVDALISNFHLPESSLLMMVCAFAGREFVLEAYTRAVKNAYRFFSYGDATLIL